MGRRLRIALVLAVTLVLPSFGRSQDHLIVLRRKVWVVNSHGQIAPFLYKFPVSYEESVLGSTVPLPSPDGRWVAFGRDYDIHLLNVSSGHEHQITRLGQRPRKGYTFADVLVDAWSSDSRKILFAVAPGETTSECGELQAPNAPFGFYIYDVATGTTQPAVLPKTFQFEAWLPDGCFLGVMPGRRPCEKEKLVMFPPGDTQEVPIRAPTESPTHVQVSADGKLVVGLLANDTELRGRAEIVKINLATMSVTPAISLSSWTGNERPALSPNGQHISYLRMTRMAKGVPQETLIVDSRPLYPCHAPIDYRWVDERRVAVACQNEVLLLDLATRSPLSRHTLATH